MDVPDKTVWLHIKDVTYSTRSGYYKAREARLGEKEETQPHTFAWKKTIWNLKCPAKIHMLLWRTARGTLPVGTNLLRRKVTTTANCSRCGEEESELHILFHCPFARVVWNRAPLPSPLNLDSITDVKLGITMCTSLPRSPIPTANQQVTAPWLIWSLWASRNKKIFDNRNLSEAETIHEACVAEMEWKKAQEDITKVPAQTQQPATTNPSRQRPEPEIAPPGTLICQTDASWLEQSKNAGLGWVILNSDREVKVKNCKPVSFVKGPGEAEALCIFEALTSLQDHKHLKIIIESDAQNVIRALGTRKYPLHLAGIIDDILILAGTFRDLSFRFIPRSHNLIADDLSKTAVRSMTIGPSITM